MCIWSLCCSSVCSCAFIDAECRWLHVISVISMPFSPLFDYRYTCTCCHSSKINPEMYTAFSAPLLCVQRKKKRCAPLPQKEPVELKFFSISSMSSVHSYLVYTRIDSVLMLFCFYPCKTKWKKQQQMQFGQDFEGSIQSKVLWRHFIDRDFNRVLKCASHCRPSMYHLDLLQEEKRLKWTETSANGQNVRSFSISHNFRTNNFCFGRHA